MPVFSQRSKDKLKTCHPDLQRLMNEVIKRVDITILCGHRDKEAQNGAYNAGRSKVRYPHSRHNKVPSLAVDIAPYPIDWNDIERFIEVSEIVKTVADELQIEIEYGGDWHSFKDYPHYQLRVPRDA